MNVAPNTNPTANMVQWPTPTNPPALINELSITASPVELYWFINDNIAYGSPQFPTPYSIPGCTGACKLSVIKDTAVTLPTGGSASGFDYVIDTVANTMKLYFTQASLIGTYSPLWIHSIGIYDPAMYQNAMYLVKNTHKVHLISPNIVPLTGLIGQYDYIIDASAYSHVAPSTPYTDDVVATYPALSGDSRLTINYGFYEGATQPTWLTFDQATSTLSVQTNDEALEAVHTIQIKAWFVSDPSTKVDGETIKFNLIDKCRYTIIAGKPFTPVEPLYYQVGEGQVDFSFPEWTHSYTASGDCGPFYYTLSLPPTQTPAITL